MKSCHWCGIPFAGRSDARFCRPTHRVAANRRARLHAVTLVQAGIASTLDEAIARDEALAAEHRRRLDTVLA